MKMVRYLLAVCILLGGHSVSWSQKNDTIPSYIKGKQGTGYPVADTLGPQKKDSLHRHKGSNVDNPYKVDSATRKKHDPRKATLYSTFFPGLGQIYNRKYWKLPLVYAAVGIPAYTYFYNKSWYQKCQNALAVLLDTPLTNAKLNKVDPKLRVFLTNGDDNSLRSYRNQFRKDQDYSVIFFLLFWGLQIVDATVDAHLMDFDVSPELSMHLQDGSGSARSVAGLGGANTPTGISLVFDLHKARYKPIFVP
jgi:hypothetical protein